MNIIKRNNKMVEFNHKKISNAISKAMAETDRGVDNTLSINIANTIEQKYSISGVTPTVEEIQDDVELLLAEGGRFDASKRYVLYRSERAKLRDNAIPEKYKFLSSDFLTKYKHREDPFTTELGKFVYYRTYSRPIPEENRRERWWETVARVVDFNSQLEVDAYKRQGITITERIVSNIRDEAKNIYKMMYNLKLFPSGRSLWIGGTESSKAYPLSNFNCFSRDTEFITDKGVKSFLDFEDGDIAKVLSRTGGWREARVTNFGEAELVKLNLRKGKAVKTIETTKNHRWFVEKSTDKGKYEMKETSSLKKGDVLREKKRYETQSVIPCKVGIQHGMVHGDGTYDKFKNHCRIALVGEKQELLRHFTTGSVSTAGKNGQTVVYGLPSNWKEMPSMDSNIEYLYGFLIGLFATDGSNSNNVHTISSSVKEDLLRVRDICSLVGMKYGDLRLVREISPFNGEEAPLYSINLSSETLSEDFLLRSRHKDNHKQNNRRMYWTVESIEDEGRIDDVWCVEEPDTTSFTLDGNILTYNCSFVTIDSLKKFSEIFAVLMLGTGAGLSVERKYIEKLPKINSKINIIHKDYDEIPKDKRKEHTELIQKSNNVLEIAIGDSKFGWSRAMELYLDILSSKQYIDIDMIVLNYDSVRPAGEILKTFGGRASGHTAIKTMFTKIDRLFKTGKHDNLNQWQTVLPIDALDIATIIAENVISGGVRRSALIVFCDNDEKEVLEAKSNLYYPNDDGEWVANDKILHRMLSNNTVFYNEHPTREQLKKHFELIKTSGEPAFGNMAEMKRRRDDVQGGNPLTV